MEKRLKLKDSAFAVIEIIAFLVITIGIGLLT